MDQFADQLDLDFESPHPGPRVNEAAAVLIAGGRFSAARDVLETALVRMPADWKPALDSGEFLQIAFWDEQEFLAYSERARRAERSIFWICDSYSKAWYQLATIAVEDDQLDRALVYLNCGIELELDHPDLWCEKGYVLARMNQHREAYECFCAQNAHGSGRRVQRSPGRCADRVRN